jgi:Uma2 family endonuclease
MTETATPQTVRRDDPDPFRYGWRHVRAPDGMLTMEQVPLTLEDVLHPQEEDRFVERGGHYDDQAYLYGVFKSRVGSNPAADVSANLRVQLDPDPTNELAHGPDVAVYFGLPRKIPRDLGTYRVGIHGPLPSLIVEIVSPHTRANDVEKKMREYHDLGVPEFVIVDAAKTSAWYHLSIMPFRRGPRRYIPQGLDEAGRYWLDAVQVWIGTQPGPYGSEHGKVACWEDEADAPLPDYEDLTVRAREIASRAAELERARADAERAKADAERAKADAERERDEALARLRAMEEELKRLRGQP